MVIKWEFMGLTTSNMASWEIIRTPMQVFYTGKHHRTKRKTLSSMLWFDDPGGCPFAKVLATSMARPGESSPILGLWQSKP